MDLRRDKQGQKVGRTIKEIMDAARQINVEDRVSKFYEEPTVEGGFSYSLEDGEYYDIEKQEDREALVEKYGSGLEDTRVYIVGITKNEGRQLRREEAIEIAKACVESRIVPFIGHWIDERGLLHEDIAVTRDHGVTREWAEKERQRNSQKAVVEVKRNEYSIIKD